MDHLTIYASLFSFRFWLPTCCVTIFRNGRKISFWIAYNYFTILPPVRFTFGNCKRRKNPVWAEKKPRYSFLVRDLWNKRLMQYPIANKALIKIVFTQITWVKHDLQPPAMTESADVALITVTSILIITCIVGNCFVCAVVMKNRQMR